MPSDLKDDIIAYEAMRSDLEAKYLGKWVLLYDRALINTFDSFHAAAQEAVRKYGRGPYLIRKVGAAAVTLSAAVMYNPVHGHHSMRV